jgi:DNA repair protein RecO (recombination protein O)
MLHKTKGIVLKATKYSESSLIIHVFTEKFGIQSYLLNGVRKNNSKIKTGMLQPLHLLEMVVYHKPAGGLQRISELKNKPVFTSIPFDIIKSSLAIFMCDVIYHSIREQQSDERLFNFLCNSIEMLDVKNDHLVNFHLLFLLQLSKFLGFYPSNFDSLTNEYFDLRNGIFLKDIPDHPLFVDKELTVKMKQLLELNFEELHHFSIDAENRKRMLNCLIQYYGIHIEKFGDIKSHFILEEVLS